MGSSGKKAIRKISKSVGLEPDKPKRQKAVAPTVQATDRAVRSAAPTALGAATQAQSRRQARATLATGTNLTDVFGLGDDARRRRKTLLGE